MDEITLVSWNVNGIRACVKKGFLDWLSNFKPDICCIQETKAHVEQLTEDTVIPDGYKSYWFSAERKGYSSVGVYIKDNMRISAVHPGINIKKLDIEGRIQIIEIGKTLIYNCYFPNSQHERARLGYKLDYNNSILKELEKKKKQGFNIIICGDFNVAHNEIDLKNPKQNIDNPGFLPEEREWMTKFLSKGYIDTFRYFYPDLKDKYSWWSYRMGARPKNIGWRIDYFCVDKRLGPDLIDARIHPDVLGSDHCPVSLKIKNIFN